MQVLLKNISRLPRGGKGRGLTIVALELVVLIAGTIISIDDGLAREHKYTTYEKIEWICSKPIEREAVRQFREGKNWKYLYVKQRLREKGLPSIFAIIPIIESGYKERAISSAGAAGIWQLMPETARDMGLIVNKYIDERFKIKAATGAAIKYLDMLYNRFNGDINYTLAAYNMGPGATERAIKKYNARSIRDIPLPPQTHNYIAKFWAYASVIKRGCPN